jgi:uncharacterized membrane protein
VQFGPLISKAWNLVRADLALFILGYLIVVLIIMVSCITIVGPIIIGGPLMFGYLRIVQKRYKGEPAEIGDVFQGFQTFGKAFVTMLLFCLIMAGMYLVCFVLGFILGYIPVLGVILGPLVSFAISTLVGGLIFFAMPLAALSEASPTEAISRSFKFCFANFPPMMLLSLVAGLIAMAGALACGIGMLLTVPLAITISVVAYNEYYLPNAQSAM